jgi:signal transduction histidine kinase/CheY-like chemotaxis protein
MQSASRTVALDEASLAQSREALHETELRAIIWVTIGACWFLQCVAVIALSDSALTKAVLLNVFLAINAVVALSVISRRRDAAALSWHLGLLAIITISLQLTEDPHIALFYILIPLMATITMGSLAGLVFEVVISLLVFWVMPATAASGSSLQAFVALAGAVCAALGWVVWHSASEYAAWSMLAYESALSKTQEALDERVTLKQTQDDLSLANRELARLSERLKLLQQVADEARRAKQEFVAKVSHELRTPLNMIIGFSEMIPKLSHIYGVELPPMLLGDIAAIQRNSQHLSKLVDDVLDLSQIEAGHMALNRSWGSVRGIVDDAATAVRALYDAKGLALRIELPENLPEVYCDATRIRQVVMNLLSNAGRLTEKGGVRLWGSYDKENVIIAVSDTGPGIAQKDQERLFEPFQQIEAAIHQRRGGTGLGLSISRQFVEMHGGRIWLESALGTGSTFYFALPIDPWTTPLPADGGMRRSFSQYQEYRLRTRPSRAPAPEFAARFVLLEGGNTLRHLFNRYQQGAEVMSAKTVEEAANELSRLPAQGLVINAPLTVELAPQQSALASLPYGTPTIGCWVLGENEIAAQLGVVRYFVKPLASEQFLTALAEMGDSVETVLLVDDSPEMLRLLARMLTMAPKTYRVLQATSGTRALALLRERHPDLMVLDLAMPGMDGYEVLRIKSGDPTIEPIPTIVVSARDPAGELVASSMLTVTRSGGLSARELLACISAISEILVPHPKAEGQRAPSDDLVRP